MIDTSKIRTVWEREERARLCSQGWTVKDENYAEELGMACWHMYPPEPVPPTLAEQMRSRYDELIQDGNSEEYAGLYRQVADALEHYALVEEAARKVVVRPHEKGNGVLVDNDLLWKLADALAEGKKAPGADALEDQ